MDSDFALATVDILMCSGPEPWRFALRFAIVCPYGRSQMKAKIRVMNISAAAVA